MEQAKTASGLKTRIRSGRLTKQDVARRMAELAFGKANDCVKLVLEQEPELDKLDLSLLSEVKRSDKGAVEVRLIDRLRVLEQLSQMTGDDSGGMESFLQALRNGGDDG